MLVVCLMNTQLDWMQILTNGAASGPALEPRRLQLLCELAYAETALRACLQDEREPDWAIDAYSLTEERIEQIVAELNA